MKLAWDPVLLAQCQECLLLLYAVFDSYLYMLRVRITPHLGSPMMHVPGPGMIFPSAFYNRTPGDRGHTPPVFYFSHFQSVFMFTEHRAEPKTTDSRVRREQGSNLHATTNKDGGISAMEYPPLSRRSHRGLRPPAQHRPGTINRRASFFL